PAAAVEEPKRTQVTARGSAHVAAPVPESQLTFTSGYARRRAVHQAATAGAGTKSELARVEEQNHVGRGARAKPRTSVAQQNALQDQRRVTDTRADGGLFAGHPTRAR